MPLLEKNLVMYSLSALYSNFINLYRTTIIKNKEND